MINTEGHRSSHSEQVHRRRELADERRQSPLARTIVEETRILNARARLEAVNDRLSSSDEATLPPLTLASLQIEGIWLQFATGDISENEKNSRLQKTLNGWEESNPDVFELLVKENDNGITPLAEIRNSVIPPITIRAYHTKRR